MPQNSQAISYDFNKDIISNTTTRESLGMALMRVAESHHYKNLAQ